MNATKTMRRRANHWLATILTATMCAVVLPAIPVGATAHPCTEAGLNSALAAGGTATFGCSSATKIVSVSGTILDGGGLLTLSGGGNKRVLQVSANVTAELRNLTITGGKAPDGANGANGTDGGPGVNGTNGGDGGDGGAGGGILNSGTLTLTNSTVSVNTGGRGGNGGKGGNPPPRQQHRSRFLRRRRQRWCRRDSQHQRADIDE